MNKLDQTIWGVDISHYQRTVNWQELWEGGCRFVILKAGEGGSSRPSDRFEEYREGAVKVGLPWGVYWFARSGSGVSHGAACSRVLSSGPKPPLGVWLDLEPGGPSGAVGEYARGFNSQCQLRGIYTGLGYIQSLRDSEKQALARMGDVWWARYRPLMQGPGSVAPWSEPLIWQHSSKARVPGITTDVDRNIASPDLLPHPITPPTPKEEETMRFYRSKETSRVWCYGVDGAGPFKWYVLNEDVYKSLNPPHKLDDVPVISDKIMSAFKERK